jgi:hypothetical protein
MSERPCCGCPLCRIETELLTEFLDNYRLESCRRILASAPQLVVFSGLGPLLAHLRLCRDTPSTDGVLRALLQAKRMFGDGTAERILLLAFLPHMHAAVRSVLRRYPQLSPEDASQNVLQSLLRFLDSGHLQARQDYLGFAIARRVKRAAFEWAEIELRSIVFESSSDTFDLNGFDDSFERLVLLRHFLDRAVSRGVLEADELDMLIQFKLENGFDDDTPETHTNAHRQRLKRLVQKLRRLAAARSVPRKRR